jgi:hypothetical protein
VTALGPTAARLPNEENCRLDGDRFKEWLTGLARRELDFLPNTRELTSVTRALADEARTRNAVTDLPADVYRRVIEDSLLQALVEFMRARLSHGAYVGEWLVSLNETAKKCHIDVKHKTWPRVAWVLGEFFRDKGSLLMAVDLMCEYGDHQKKGRWVTLTRMSPKSDALSTSASPSESLSASSQNATPDNNLGHGDAPDAAEETLLKKLLERKTT